MIIVSQDNTIAVNHESVKGFWIAPAYLDKDTRIFRIYVDLTIFTGKKKRTAYLAEYCTEGDAIKALNEMVTAIVQSRFTLQKAFYFEDE